MNKLLNIARNTSKMSDEERKKTVEVVGSIMLWSGEARSINYMANELHLKPWQVDQDLDEILYVLRHRLGLWRYLKILFMK